MKKYFEKERKRRETAPSKGNAVFSLVGGQTADLPSLEEAFKNKEKGSGSRFYQAFGLVFLFIYFILRNCQSSWSFYMSKLVEESSQWLKRYRLLAPFPFSSKEQIYFRLQHA